nr:MAG TPA: hypothetical protein [Caudoviricetes sp.]
MWSTAYKAVDGRYSMSTLATRYAVVYNLCRQPCSRMAKH